MSPPTRGSDDTRLWRYAALALRGFGAARLWRCAALTLRRSAVIYFRVRKYCSMNSSISPSKTACTLPFSTFVRWSLTI